MTSGLTSFARIASSDRGRPASRKLRCLLAPIVVAGALLAVPAFASATTYCVNDGSCSGTTEPTVQDALDAAYGNLGPDTIQIGAGTYSNPGGFAYDPGAPDNAVTIVGAGQGATTLTMPGDANAYEEVLSISGGSAVSDLSIDIPGTPGSNSHSDIGLDLYRSTANRVSVTGDSTANNERGVVMGGVASFLDGAVSLPYGGSNTGVISVGNAGLVRSTVQADTAFSNSTGGSEAGLLNRVTLKPGSSGFGIVTDAGTVSIRNSLVDLGSKTNAVGLRVANFNSSVSPKSIHANHVTIVGGGTGSKGLQVMATSPVANGAQTASATLANSTIKGPAVPIDREAQNTSPTNPGQSQASVQTFYSNYDQGAAFSFNGTNGGGAIVDSHLVPGSPTFVGGGDYTPRAGSILTDAGNPNFTGAGFDLAGNPRVRDGNGDGKARNDLGAYERQP